MDKDMDIHMENMCMDSRILMFIFRNHGNIDFLTNLHPAGAKV
jgi:hypothetical protein